MSILHCAYMLLSAVKTSLVWVMSPSTGQTLLMQQIILEVLVCLQWLKNNPTN